MKKFTLGVFVSCSIFLNDAKLFGQNLLAPNGVIGNSNNGNVNIGPNDNPNARLRIQPTETDGTLLLQTITGGIQQGFPGAPPTLSVSPFALRIEDFYEGMTQRVFNVSNTGKTSIGQFNVTPQSGDPYYLRSRDAIGVFSQFSNSGSGFGSITQNATGDEPRLGWTTFNGVEIPRFHIGHGLANGNGLGQYNYSFIAQLSFQKNEHDFSYIGINQSEPAAPLHIRYKPDGINENEPGSDHGLLIENSGYRSHDYAIRVNTQHGDVLRFSNSGRLFIGAGLNGEPIGDFNLYVEKGIRTEKVRVDIAAENDWADYVFEEGYVLLSLSELESFIKKNKHLPGVPSAAQVVEEGIDVAEMNAILLRHVEELTLRMIEMEKVIESLK